MTGTIAFSKPLAYGSNYPEPAFPVLPHVPGSNSPRPRQSPEGVSAKFLTTRARYSLALIAKAALNEGDIALLPAYHCPALVEPFLWAGCRVKFYAMNSDLSPKMLGFAASLKAARAVVLVRYFGFDGNIAALAEMAQAEGCLVIEDLAHAPFIDQLYGDFGVTSLGKFFPVEAGSELWISRARYCEALSEKLERYTRNSLLWKLNSTIRRLRRSYFVRPRDKIGGGQVFSYFREETLWMPLSARVLPEIARHNEAEVIMLRRKNYELLDRLFSGLAIGSPLYPALQAGDVPYVYPYKIKDTATFDKIRNAGIPLFRWEELAPSACEVSNSYRGTLIQIPCHQDLTVEDLSLIELNAKSLGKSR
jgi:perosamine synthetase